MSVDLGHLEEVARDYTSAWNSGSPEAVASFYAPDGGIVINGGTPWEGRKGVAEMAAGFFADVPDLSLTCDGVRLSGDHAVYLWTFTGNHAGTGHKLRISGWEEWDLGSDLKVIRSRGCFDADEWARQTGGA